MPDPTANPVAQVANLNAGRPKFKFRFAPEDRQFVTDPQEVVLTLITLGEEQRAAARAESQKVSLSYEVLKEALVSVDGKELGWSGQDSKELVVERSSPHVRDLMLKAYHKLHIASEDASKAFLATMEIVV